jgi:hypothetical protein
VRGIPLTATVVLGVLASACSPWGSLDRVPGVERIAGVGNPPLDSAVWSPTDEHAVLLTASDMNHRTSEVSTLDSRTGARTMLLHVESRIAIGSGLSPDGGEALIGIASDTVGEPSELLRVSRVNLEQHLVAPGAGAGAWSHDGTHIAYFGRSEDPRGGEGTRSISLYDVDLGASKIIYSASSLAPLGMTWSPDDRRILFASGEPKSSSLFILDIQSGEVASLTGLGSHNFPDWSKRMDLIVYQSFAEDGLVSEIHLVRPDGSCDWTLPLSEEVSSPSWVAGEAKIAFVGPDGLHTVDLDTLSGGHLESLMCGGFG